MNTKIKIKIQYKYFLPHALIRHVSDLFSIFFIIINAGYDMPILPVYHLRDCVPYQLVVYCRLT